MGVSRGLMRLLEVRTLEEELSQAALEDALGYFHLLESALTTAEECERVGWRHVTSSAASADAVDRIAGIEEVRAARRRAASLKPRILDAEGEVAARQAEFLAKRMERRQVETLIQKIETEDMRVAARRAQQEMDDRYLAGSAGAVRKAERQET
jgi:hypothetical protein